MGDQPSQNNSNTERSRLDSGQIIQDIHIPEDNAIKTIKANSLVPREFSRVELTLVASGPAKNEIETATYYDAGIKQVSSFFARGDQQPSPEITSIMMYGADPTELSQTYFQVDDPSGRVAVFYALDGDLTIPTTGASRDLKVDILTGDTDVEIAEKTRLVVNGDAQFIAVRLNSILTITSSTNGNKLNAEDADTGFIFEVTDGKVSKTLNNKYFFLYSPSTTYYVWYNVAAGGADPTPGGTGIEVAISADADEEEVRINTIQALNETAFFTARAEETEIKVTTNQQGPVTDAIDGNTDFTHFRTRVAGVNRVIIRTVILTYNGTGELITAESY